MHADLSGIYTHHSNNYTGKIYYPCYTYHADMHAGLSGSISKHCNIITYTGKIRCPCRRYHAGTHADLAEYVTGKIWYPCGTMQSCMQT